MPWGQSELTTWSILRATVVSFSVAWRISAKFKLIDWLISFTNYTGPIAHLHDESSHSNWQAGQRDVWICTRGLARHQMHDDWLPIKGKARVDLGYAVRWARSHHTQAGVTSHVHTINFQYFSYPENAQSKNLKLAWVSVMHRKFIQYNECSISNMSISRLHANRCMVIGFSQLAKQEWIWDRLQHKQGYSTVWTGVNSHVHTLIFQYFSYPENARIRIGS